jgi:hypothetical protein
VAIGLTAALALALFSVVRVSSGGLTYRQPEIWSNASVIVLDTQPDRFPALVDQYAALVTSDEVIASLKRQGLLKLDAGATEELPITAAAVPSPVTGAATPLLNITAEAQSPAAASKLAIGTTDTFIRFAKARQVRAGTPKDQRVELGIVRRGVPELTGPRSKTTPIMIFLAVSSLVVAAAFMRDNMQRRRDDEDPPYQLEAAPELDQPRSAREGGAPALRDSAFRGDPSTRADDLPNEADVESVTRNRSLRSG